ncbi:MAG: hypothetical protein ACRDS0_35010, partial [Pseudonocardiaceae bacterium]
TRVRVKAEPVGGLLDRNELIAVIEKTVGYDDGLSVTIANDVMNLLESLPGREPDPTRTGH